MGGTGQRSSQQGFEMEDVRELDLRGLKCPMPALLTARALKKMAPGLLIRVTVTDPLAPLDLAHLCERDGHRLVENEEKNEGVRRLLICRGPRV